MRSVACWLQARQGGSGQHRAAAPAPPPPGAPRESAPHAPPQDAERHHAAALDEHRRVAAAALARARAQVTAAQARAYAEQGALAAQARAPAHQLLDLYPVIVPHRARHSLACSAAVEAACLRRRLPSVIEKQCCCPTACKPRGPTRILGRCQRQQALRPCCHSGLCPASQAIGNTQALMGT